MFVHSVRKLLFLTVVCLTALAALPRQSLADDGPVLRTFGFLVAGSADAPDYLSEDSLTITVLPDAAADVPTDTIEFSSDDSLYTNEDTAKPFAFAKYKGTRWVSRPAHHSVRGGQRDAGSYYWLEDELTPDVPPVGAYAFTGPDGTIVGGITTTYNIDPCDGTHCSSADVAAGHWYFMQNNLSGKRFVIVTAWFSR